jgi:hypothetical protein
MHFSSQVHLFKNASQGDPALWSVLEQLLEQLLKCDFGHHISLV